MDRDIKYFMWMWKNVLFIKSQCGFIYSVIFFIPENSLGVINLF